MLVALSVSCAGPSTEEPPGPDALVPPPRIATRRLNRSELDHTVRDLIGTEQRPGSQLPADDATDGFDVVAEGLVVSPLHVELFVQAAAALASEIVDRPLDGPIDAYFEAEDGLWTCTAAYQGIAGNAFGVYSGGALERVVDVPVAGIYRLSARWWAQQAGPDDPLVTLGVDGVSESQFTVLGTDLATGTWGSVELRLPKGRAHLQIRFLNDYSDAETGEDRNLFVDAARLEGPLDYVYEPNPAYDRVMLCEPTTDKDPRGCIRRVLSEFTPKAWRRPVTDDELDGLMAVADEILDAGDSPRWAAEFALQTVLASPWFVMHVEPEPADTEAPVPVDDWTLASRLSYFLWSSMPDDTLRAHAEAGELQDLDVLAAEVSRMLQDPKADALAQDLAGQWLLIRGLDDVEPDDVAYPVFVDALRDSMRTSMQLSFMDLVREPVPMTELLLSNHVWVDKYLSGHYGMTPSGSRSFERVDITAFERPGWMGLPGLLTATSYPTRTSPVKRGVWVLTDLLCDPTRAPPADVGAFPEPDGDAQTVRERLELHRANPVCAGCHDRIDPLGLALEQFDGVGRWRELDGDQPVDATGQLPDGTPVDGEAQLAAVIAADPRFEPCVAHKVYTYAHGRAPADDEAPRLARIVERFRRDGATFEALVQAIVADDAFRSHGGAP